MKFWNKHNQNETPVQAMNPESGGRSGAFFAVLLLVAVIGGISIGWYFNRMAHIKSIAVKGNYYTETSEILAKADIPMEVSPDSVSFLDAIHRIETLPYVKEAMLSKRPSGRLEVAVVERQPIGLLINGSSRRYFDEAGVVLPVVSGKKVDVPLVYGIGTNAIADTLKSTAFDQVRAFLLIAREDPVAASTLSEIAWTADEGIVALSTENGIRIVFGSMNLQEGIRNWNLFYTQVIAIRGSSAFSSIDLRFNGQVITKES
jgi:cell division protein FtsQ